MSNIDLDSQLQNIEVANSKYFKRNASLQQYSNTSEDYDNTYLPQRETPAPKYPPAEVHYDVHTRSLKLRSIRQHRGQPTRLSKRQSQECKRSWLSTASKHINDLQSDNTKVYRKRNKKSIEKMPSIDLKSRISQNQNQNSPRSFNLNGDLGNIKRTTSLDSDPL